jgi:hypothetical protein
MIKLLIAILWDVQATNSVLDILIIFQSPCEDSGVQPSGQVAPKAGVDEIGEASHGVLMELAALQFKNQAALVTGGRKVLK